MTRRAIVTASSGDAGYIDKVFSDWWPSLEASTDLSESDVWLMEYGISDEQRRTALDLGLRVLSCPRDGAVNNLRWRDLPRLLEENGPYGQVLLTDGSDIYFQRDVDAIFDLARQRIGAHAERYGDLSLDIYLRRSGNCMTPDEILFSLDRAPINSGLICGPVEDMLALCREVSDRIPVGERGVVGPDQTLVHYLLHRDGFAPLPEGHNYVAVTARHAPRVIDGKICRRGEPVHVVHNAAAGFRYFENFAFPNEDVRIDRRVLGRLRRHWRKHAICRRTPLLRGFTWAGKVRRSGGRRLDRSD